MEGIIHVTETTQELNLWCWWCVWFIILLNALCTILSGTPLHGFQTSCNGCQKDRTICKRLSQACGIVYCSVNVTAIQAHYLYSRG